MVTTLAPHVKVLQNFSGGQEMYPTVQTMALLDLQRHRYSDPDLQTINSSTFAGSRTGFTHRLRDYGIQMSPPGVSNFLVNESAVEARRLADYLVR